MPSSTDYMSQKRVNEDLRIPLSWLSKNMAVSCEKTVKWGEVYHEKATSKEGRFMMRVLWFQNKTFLF